MDHIGCAVGSCGNNCSGNKVRERTGSIRSTAKMIKVTTLWRNTYLEHFKFVLRAVSFAILFTRPRPKAGNRVLNPPGLFVFFFLFTRRRKSALLRRWLVASRQSWDVDWSRIGTLETLIGSLWKSLTGELMVKYELCIWLVGRSVPPQVDSDKLKNELHS